MKILIFNHMINFFTKIFNKFSFYHPNEDYLPEKKCPLFPNIIADNPRYPNAICPNCISEAKTLEGNDFLWEKYKSKFRSRSRMPILVYGKRKEINEACIVRGHKCWAQNSHFNGLIIQANPVFVPDFMCYEEMQSK